MTDRPTVFRGAEIVRPDGRERADVVVRGGKVAGITRDADTTGMTVRDVSGLVMLPGVVDPHSHLWESGFVSDPDFADGTASAVAGGITTIIDMPLTVPEVLDTDTFWQKVELGRKTSHIDFALHGGLSPHTMAEIPSLWEAGCTAFKIFTCETGCPMEGFVDDGDLYEALEAIATVGGLATVHTENDALVRRNLARLRQSDRTDNLRFADWRSELAEIEAIQRVILYAEATGARVNIVHTSTPGGTEMAARARRRGVSVTVETCPHYLYFSTDELAERGSWITCSPAVRGPEARATLRKMVADGRIQTVGSDHGPVDPALKQGKRADVLACQPGMPGNETMVPLMLNLVARSELSLERTSYVLSEGPARLFGLYPRKGAIRVGSDADFTIVDPAARWTIEAGRLVGRAGWTPYEGMEVTGRVELTIVRGEIVAEAGRPTGHLGRAEFVPRGDG